MLYLIISGSERKYIDQRKKLFKVWDMYYHKKYWENFQKRLEDWKPSNKHVLGLAPTLEGEWRAWGLVPVCLERPRRWCRVTLDRAKTTPGSSLHHWSSPVKILTIYFIISFVWNSANVFILHFSSHLSNSCLYSSNEPSDRSAPAWCLVLVWGWWGPRPILWHYNNRTHPHAGHCQ